MQILLTGAILSVGARTVTAALRVMGLADAPLFQRFHRVLNRSKWSSVKASRRLLLALIDAFVPEGPLIMALDDTIERRRGAKIAARGIYRDPVNSTGKNLVKTSGLRWLCLMLVAPIPWAGRHWALPFCSIIAPSKRYYVSRSRPVRTLLERARLILYMVRRWLPERQMVVVADSSFSALDFLDKVGRDVCFVTRLKLNAGLYDPPPTRVSGTRGSPRIKGARQPAFRDVLKDPATVWHPLTVPY